MAPKRLTFVTGNANKLEEVRSLLGDSVDLEAVKLDLPELQGTIEEISKDKSRRAAEILNKPVLVEDTCLSFNIMGEMPGPYIKWFLEALGVENLHKMLDGFEDKSAQAICTFAFCKGPGHEPLLFQGRTIGKIVPARGPKKFGWDPTFEYEGKTYAEMTLDEKNKISHRYKALAKFREWLEKE